MQALAHTQPHSPPQQDRLRLIALLIASRDDLIPMPCSRIRGESGRGDPRGRFGMTEHELDEAIDRLADREPIEGNVIEISAIRAASKKKHPAYRALDEALAVLALEDRFSAKLVLATLLGDTLGKGVAARIHALPYLAGGQPGVPVDSPRYRFVKAMTRLSKLMPREMVFPKVIYQQAQGWEQWLAALADRKTIGGKKYAPRNDRASLDERDSYVRELRAAGLTQLEIAKRLGITQGAVSKILSPGSGLDG